MNGYYNIYNRDFRLDDTEVKKRWFSVLLHLGWIEWSGCLCKRSFYKCYSMTSIFLVTLSLGGADAYAELSDAIAVQRVVSQGGKDRFFVWNIQISFLS